MRFATISGTFPCLCPPAKSPMTNEKYEGYAWIKVPRYVMDESKSWEEAYQQLESTTHPGNDVPDRQGSRAGR